MNRKSNPILQIALTANIFEGYESSLIGFMALEIGRRFFPTSNDKTALMSSFAVFASSFLARPLGSVFFGLWSYRRGAGAALKLSLILVAVPTALIAVLPTYVSLGYLATMLLIALKLVQGFAEGGEAPLSAYYVALNAAPESRGLYCGIAACSGFLGWLLASLVVFALPHALELISRVWPGLDRAVPRSEAWRWPFLVCIPLSLWIFSIRRSALSSTVPHQSPLRGNWRKLPITPLLQVTTLVAFTTTQLFTLFIWLPNYLHVYLGATRDDAHLSNLIALAVFSATMVGAGYASRWIAAPRLAWFAITSLTVLVYPLFIALQSAGFATLLIVQLAFSVMAGCLFGVIFIVLPDLLKDNWQSLGMTVAYTLPVMIFGGTAPVVCGFLIARTNLLTAPALYIVAMGLFALPVAYRLSFKRPALASGESMLA
jgi:MHS family proline/betaine transporter-like MFS transporter